MLSCLVSTNAERADRTCPMLFRMCLSEREVGKYNPCEHSSIAARWASSWHWDCETAWSGRRTSIHHDSEPICPSNGSQVGQSKIAFVVQCMEHISPVQEAEVLVVPMRVHNLVLGLPWFQSRDSDVHWLCGRLLALRTPGGAEVVAVDQVDHQECPGDVPWCPVKEEACSEGGSSIPDIQILGETALDDPVASEQVVGTLFLKVGDCPWQLAATMEGIADGGCDWPQALDRRAGSSGGSRGRSAST